MQKIITVLRSDECMVLCVKRFKKFKIVLLREKKIAQRRSSGIEKRKTRTFLSGWLAQLSLSLSLETIPEGPNGQLLAREDSFFCFGLGITGDPARKSPVSDGSPVQGFRRRERDHSPEQHSSRRVWFFLCHRREPHDKAPVDLLVFGDRRQVVAGKHKYGNCGGAVGKRPGKHPGKCSGKVSKNIIWCTNGLQ